MAVAQRDAARDLAQSFSQAQPLPGRAASAFARLMLVVSVVAGLAHVGFIFMFLYVGVPELALVNLGSVLLYVLSASLIRHGFLTSATMLAGAEVLVHGVVATVVIGWDSGFHHYIVLILPFVVMELARRPVARIALLLAVGLAYLGLDFAYRGAAPAVAVPAALLSSLHYINLATMLAMLAVLTSTYYHLVRASERRLQELASTDPLTQLRNRRSAMEAAQRAAAAFDRGGPALSFVLVDIDHFKRINDQHGHAMGDEVLCAIAHLLRNDVREHDLVARWGGEEFLLLLPATDQAGASLVAERLRAAVQAMEAGPGQCEQALSITLGVAQLARGEGVDHAIMRADRALYEGKQSGRNRVVLAGQA